MLWRIHFISTCSALCNCGQALCGPEFLTFKRQHQVCLCLYWMVPQKMESKRRMRGGMERRQVQESMAWCPTLHADRPSSPCRALTVRRVLRDIPMRRVPPRVEARMRMPHRVEGPRRLPRRVAWTRPRVPRPSSHLARVACAEHRLPIGLHLRVELRCVVQRLVRSIPMWRVPPRVEARPM